MILRFVRSIRFAILLDRAWSFLARGEVANAVHCIERIEEIGIIDDTEYQIRKSYIRLRAGYYEEAARDFDIAWKTTNEDRDIDDETKLYLLRYILVPAVIALTSLNAKNYSKIRYSHIDESIVLNVNSGKVKKKWREEFPYRFEK